ncbi:alanine racemase [Paratissierella segnis]|jgi:alanine racemase|uniref:Alanine racemase n=1 Tax=Paratissierella segnis TaxID=2763679 RepID=A0A926EVJ7_9FIRM|nr:alanine racemase [Paratissierella segnis]MBC8587020.1 alanine racemase [Paratissierella segnis]
MDNLREVRPVYLEINMDNLTNNYNEIRRIVNPNTKIMAVIKANAYGHGSVELAKMYEKIGVDRLAVSIISEAVELRREGIKIPIQLLNYTPESQLGLVIDNDIIQGIYTYEDAKLLSDLAVKKGKKAKIHIKIDTGMGRIGFLPNEDSIKEIVKIHKLPKLEMEGMFTHFAKADETDKSFTKIQFERFNWVSEKLEENGIELKVKHVSNSAAIIDLPEYNLDLVRPGIILYGYYPSDEVNKNKINLKPAMTLKSKISNIKTVPEGTGISYGHIYSTSKKSVIATVPIGYADGYSRILSGKADVCINNKRAPIVGRICMDQMMVDITGIDNANIGDEVVLFGYDNESYPRVEELASLLGTINYEFICMMGRRIPRVFIKDNEIIEIKDYLEC